VGVVEADVAEQGQDHQRRISLEAAATIPGIAAIVLGVLYTLGALFKTAELQRAHVSVSDYLPLIPLQQMLGAGIATIAPLVPILILLIPLVVLTGVFYDRLRGSRKHTPTLYGRSLVAIGIALTVFLVISLPPLIGITLVLAVLVAVAMQKAEGGGVRERTYGAIAAAYLIVGVGYVLDYSVHPKPLPIVTVNLDNGSTTRGRLILDTGSVYYIAGADRRSIVIEHGAAKSSQIRSRPRHSQSTFDYLRWW
jgi:hypothetical protein